VLSIRCVERFEMLEMDGARTGLIKETLERAENNRRNVEIHFIHKTCLQCLPGHTGPNRNALAAGIPTIINHIFHRNVYYVIKDLAEPD